MSAVRSWPTYLLRDIPDEVRAALEADAALEERSMAETLREILCAHYELDCEAVETTGPPPEKIAGTDTMILRLQPALFSAIKDQAGAERGAMRRNILDILASHYSARV